jgi:hypothetical protein
MALCFKSQVIANPGLWPKQFGDMMRYARYHAVDVSCTPKQSTENKQMWDKFEAAVQLNCIDDLRA